MKAYLLNSTAAAMMLLGITACSDSDAITYTDADGTVHSHHEFFDLTCTTPVKCTQTANTYVVNVNGLFIEPNQEFIDACLQKRQIHAVTNEYCKWMYSPGDSERFTTSADLIQHTIKNGFNPTDPDVDRRLKAAKEKLYSQSI